eukprot:g168.t1
MTTGEKQVKMPPPLDVAMMLWSPAFDGTAAAMDPAAMRTSMLAFLEANFNVADDQVGRVCHDLRLAWMMLSRLRVSNGLNTLCYDSCIWARDGTCDENYSSGANGAPDHKTTTTSAGAGDKAATKTTLTMWSSDYHTGLVADLKHFFPAVVAPKLTATAAANGHSHHTVAIEWLDRSLSATQLKNNLAAMAKVDAFFGALPVCGLLGWIPFGKSMIAVEGTVYSNGIRTGSTLQTCKVVNVYVHVKGGKRQPQVNFAGVAADAAMAKMLNDGEAKRKFPTWCISGRSGASTNVLNDNSIGQRRNPSLCERRMFRVHNMNKVLPDFDLTKLTASTDCQVIVSTCTQESFMSGLEMYATNIPLFHPKPAGNTPTEAVKDFVVRPGIGLYVEHEVLSISSVLLR